MPTPVRHPHRKPKTFGRTAIAAGVAALGLGGALLAAWLPVSYTHLRAHETCADLVCRLLLEKKKKKKKKKKI